MQTHKVTTWKNGFHTGSLIFAVALLSQLLSGCYIMNFFKGGKGGGGSAEGGVLGQYIGEAAGGADEAALKQLYAISSSHAPAALRPDPDLFVRRLLRQYRPEGATIARQIGAIEPYRELLGGATEDFKKQPQDSYDATSLLAVLKVGEEICRGLVAPNPYEHGDWETILPYPASDERGNVQWLVQRFTGKALADVTDAQVTELIAIMKQESDSGTNDRWGNTNEFTKYVPACSTLTLDAEALYL